MKVKKYTVFSWIVTIFMISLIFIFSSQDALVSTKVSDVVTEKFYNGKVERKSEERIIAPDSKELNKKINFDLVGQEVRKQAHTILFFLLCLSLCNLIAQYTNKILYILIYSYGMSVIYAFLDEFHQIFVKGRGPHLSDVVIDARGAFAGIVLYLIIYFLIKRKKAKGNV